MDTNQSTCKHTWVGMPVGCEPHNWVCFACGASMTAGEMILMNILMKYMKDVESWKPLIEKHQKCMHS